MHCGQDGVRSGPARQWPGGHLVPQPRLQGKQAAVTRGHIHIVTIATGTPTRVGHREAGLAGGEGGGGGGVARTGRERPHLGLAVHARAVLCAGGAAGKRRKLQGKGPGREILQGRNANQGRTHTPAACEHAGGRAPPPSLAVCISTHLQRRRCVADRLRPSGLWVWPAACGVWGGLC